MSKNTWWSNNLEAVTQRSIAYLRRHFPRIADSHADIASEVKIQLAELISRHPDSYPKSWFADDDSPAPEETSYFFQLSQTILRRRIADYFRDGIAQWAREVDIEAIAPELLKAPAEDHEKRLSLMQALRICVEVIGTLSADDRLLVSRLTGTSGRNEAAFSDAERQRIHRLRKRLADAIRKQLGESVATLLRSD